MYSVVVIPPKGKKYVVKAMSSSRGEATNLVTSLTLTESKGQLAQRATIKMFNRYIDGLGYPSNLFPVKSRVFIYAKGAGVDKGKEVFRGYVWETNYTRSDSSELTLTCYDNLIYFMNSEALHYFSKGKKTKEIDVYKRQIDRRKENMLDQKTLVKNIMTGKDGKLLIVIDNKSEELLEIDTYSIKGNYTNLDYQPVGSYQKFGVQMCIRDSRCPSGPESLYYWR